MGRRLRTPSGFSPTTILLLLDFSKTPDRSLRVLEISSNLDGLRVLTGTRISDLMAFLETYLVFPVGNLVCRLEEAKEARFLISLRIDSSSPPPTAYLEVPF